MSQNEEADATKGTTKKYELVEVGGDRYPSLEAARAALLKPLARALVAAILAGRTRAGISSDLVTGQVCRKEGSVTCPGLCKP